MMKLQKKALSRNYKYIYMIWSWWYSWTFPSNGISHYIKINENDRLIQGWFKQKVRSRKKSVKGKTQLPLYMTNVTQQFRCSDYKYIVPNKTLTYEHENVRIFSNISQTEFDSSLLVKDNVTISSIFFVRLSGIPFTTML